MPLITSFHTKSFPGKCSEPHPRDDFRRVTSPMTPPRTGVESVFKDFPGDLTNSFLSSEQSDLLQESHRLVGGKL